MRYSATVDGMQPKNREIRYNHGLKDWSEEPDQSLNDFVEFWAAFPVGFRDLITEFKVTEENVAHPPVEFFRINHEISFKIILKTAEVKIHRTRRYKIVIHNHGLCMKHTRKI